jgi:Rrf2 family protein
MISDTSKYALRAISSLGSLDEGGSLLARDLSTRAGVPFTYLSKILVSLAKAGILLASRGRGGGYRLARPADQISLIDVVEIFDGISARPDCFFGGDRKCSDDDPCSAHDAFKDIRRQYIEFLEQTTIADVAAPSFMDGAPASGLPHPGAG